MFRSIPVANKLCLDKELKRSWDIHQHKLKKLKCSIDQTKPEEFSFLYSRPKREEFKVLRNSEILRENTVLINKISHIAQQSDLGKLLKKAKNAEPQNLKKTLNEPFRKRELAKIVEDNQQMLKRIQQRRSCYNNRQMARERQTIEKNINLISAFPYKDFKQNKTQVNLWMIRDSPHNRSVRETHKNSPKTASSKHGSLPGEFLMKKTQKINGKYFLVNITVSKSDFVIQLDNLQDVTEKYCLKIPEAEARKFLNTYFDNDLEKMLENLLIDPKDNECYLKYEVPKAQQTVPCNKLPRINDNDSQEIPPLDDNKATVIPSNSQQKQAVISPVLTQL